MTDGVRLGAVISHRGDTTVHVGRGVGKRNFQPQTIPLTLGHKRAHAHLHVAYILELDSEAVHLAVSKSQYGIYLDEGRSKMLAHWDYERVPTNPYPAAHIQVNGQSEHFDEFTELARSRLQKECPGRPLRDFHFPVGGRRLRPTLEDVVEFLVVEDLVEARASWRDVLDEHRSAWEEIQLRAAVRRYPEVAMAQLREDGWLS